MGHDGTVDFDRATVERSLRVAVLPGPVVFPEGGDTFTSRVLAGGPASSRPTKVVQVVAASRHGTAIVVGLSRFVAREHTDGLRYAGIQETWCHSRLDHESRQLVLNAIRNELERLGDETERS